MRGGESDNPPSDRPPYADLQGAGGPHHQAAGGRDEAGAGQAVWVAGMGAAGCGSELEVRPVESRAAATGPDGQQECAVTAATPLGTALSLPGRH